MSPTATNSPSRTPRPGARHRRPARFGAIVVAAAISAAAIAVPAPSVQAQIPGPIGMAPTGIPVVFGAGQGPEATFLTRGGIRGVPPGTTLSPTLRLTVDYAYRDSGNPIVVVLTSTDSAADLGAAIDAYDGVLDAPGSGDLFAASAIADLDVAGHLLVATKLIAAAQRHNGFAVVEPPTVTYDQVVATDDVTPLVTLAADLRTAAGDSARFGALYAGGFTNVDTANIDGGVMPIPFSGPLLGAIVANDLETGFWKPTAGANVQLDVYGVTLSPTNDQVGQLQEAGVNATMVIPQVGPVPWGAATLVAGPDRTSPWARMTAVRTNGIIHRSLAGYYGPAINQPNAEPLWEAMHAQVYAFMKVLFSEGAFVGTTADQAFEVIVDATTTSPTDMLNGVVNIKINYSLPSGFVTTTFIQQVI